MIASVESNGGIKDPIVGLVSIIDIDWISRIASVGMMASKIYRGTLWTKRLPEAITDFGFEVLNLRRLEAEVLDNNPAALSFDLNLGYQIEGRKRQAVYKSGNYHDSFLIAMLRDQWKNSDRLLSYGGICNVNYKKRKNIDRVLSRIIKND
jgi:RimJ/RimL family protein N-acetyltransferase